LREKDKNWNETQGKQEKLNNKGETPGSKPRKKGLRLAAMKDNLSKVMIMI
jgi:hypothetical protein